MPKTVKPLTLAEEVSEFSQKLLKISRGVDNFYEKTNDDGTVSIVFQTPAEALIIDLHRLFPELLKTGGDSTSLKAPNLCNEGCRQDLLRFIDQGLVTSPMRCSIDNPSRTRVRDGFLEPSCVWGRVYRDMARAPSEIETFRRHASELMDSSLKIPVLGLPVGQDVWIPTLDQTLVYTRSTPVDDTPADPTTA